MFSPCTEDDILFACSKLDSYKNYNDLVILSIAKRLDLQLFTFDEELKKIASKNSVPIIKI